MNLALHAKMVQAIEASSPTLTLFCLSGPSICLYMFYFAGFWPTYKSMDLALPAEMVEGIEAFKDFYEAETKHRKLTWVYTQVKQSFCTCFLGMLCDWLDLDKQVC
jgi:hypothetical protein